MSRTFTVHYIDGDKRSGTIYKESNIKMENGELFARLDQLVTDKVLCIDFHFLPNNS